MANWFYIAGSLCFFIGTVINMVPPKHSYLTTDGLKQWKALTPEEAARMHIPLNSR